MGENKKIAFAIIANKRIGSHSSGSWHKDVATIVGDFFNIEDAHIIVEQSAITIKMSQPQRAYYLNEQFDRIVIGQVEHRSKKNLPKATLYMGDTILRIYEPYDWYSDYRAFDYAPIAILQSLQEARELKYDNLIVTSDGGLYIDTSGCGAERVISELKVIHGVI